MDDGPWRIRTIPTDGSQGTGGLIWAANDVPAEKKYSERYAVREGAWLSPTVGWEVQAEVVTDEQLLMDLVGLLASIDGPVQPPFVRKSRLLFDTYRPPHPDALRVDPCVTLPALCAGIEPGHYHAPGVYEVTAKVNDTPHSEAAYYEIVDSDGGKFPYTESLQVVRPKSDTTLAQFPTPTDGMVGGSNVAKVTWKISPVKQKPALPSDKEYRTLVKYSVSPD